MSPDKNVEAVRQKLLQRSQVGLEKYGTTTEGQSTIYWLTHLQEELMDAAVYVEAAMATLSDIDTLEQENRLMRARMERLEGNCLQMLAVLHDCDEAMVYMSEYDIPLCLPEQVKAAIAKAKP